MALRSQQTPWRGPRADSFKGGEIVVLEHVGLTDETLAGRGLGWRRGRYAGLRVVPPGRENSVGWEQSPDSTPSKSSSALTVFESMELTIETPRSGTAFEGSSRVSPGARSYNSIGCTPRSEVDSMLSFWSKEHSVVTVSSEKSRIFQSLLIRPQDEVSKILADKGLLRGVPFNVLVDRFGGVFEARPGIAGGASDMTYALSMEMLPGDTFAAFISHSWKASARFKGLTLIHRALFKRAPVMLVTALVILIALLSTAGLVVWWFAEECTSARLPLCHEPEGLSYDNLVRLPINRRHATFHAVQETLSLTLVLALLCVTVAFGHSCNMRSRRSRYFLDKCCIDQGAHDKKELGVNHLCEFVQASKEMIVLCDATYLQRMWCVCELALYTRFSTNLDGLDWHFLWAAPAAHTLALLCSFLWYVKVVPAFLPGAADIATVTTIVTGTIAAALCAVVLIWWCFATRRALRKLRTFSIRSAKCQDAGDERIIHALVTSMWTRQDVDGLSAFDEFVQNDLHDLIAQRHIGAKPAFFTLFGPALTLQCWLALVGYVPRQLAALVARLHLVGS